MSRDVVRVALLGAGVVGGGVARILAEKGEVYARQLGRPLALTGALVRDPGKPREGIDASLLTTDAHRLIDDPDTDIVVEVIGGEQPALDYISRALSQGKYVVTANKGPIACCYAALAEEARRAGVEFRFESSVMDGTPVFNLARHCLPGTRVLGFAGVLNSTTQVILDAMRRGLTLEEGIEEARRLGVTEADPWFDIDGWDSACKAAALANVVMDARVTPAEVNRRGIGRLSPEKIAETERAGKRIVLVSRGRRTAQGVSLRVRAEVLDAGDLLAQVRGTSNVLVLHTDTMGDLGVFSLNPGLDQTAYGVFSDLVDAARSL